MKLLKSKQGFTLIELLVVIGILAVLAAIAIPSVAGLIDRANASADATNANEMTNAIERFTSEYELYCQDIASGVITEGQTSGFDSAQGRVYNVTKVTSRNGIESLEKVSTAGPNTTGRAIYRDTKYPVNAETMQAIVENYTKTSSATFEPKQSDKHYYYSPDCGVVVVAPAGTVATDLNKYVQSGVDAKGNELSGSTRWIDLTIDANKAQRAPNGLLYGKRYVHVGESIDACASIIVYENGSGNINGNEIPIGTFTHTEEDIYMYGNYVGSVSEDGLSFNDGEVTFTLIDLSQMSGAFNKMYYTESDSDHLAFTFFEDGSGVINIINAVSYIPANSIIYSGNTILLPVLNHTVVVLRLEDNVLYAENGEALEDRGAGYKVINRGIYSPDEKEYFGTDQTTPNLDVVVKSGVTYIHWSAFNTNPNIKTVRIPASVTHISGNAFTASDNITDVYFEGTAAQWTAFGVSIPDNATLHILG